MWTRVIVSSSYDDNSYTMSATWEGTVSNLSLERQTKQSFVNNKIRNDEP